MSSTTTTTSVPPAGGAGAQPPLPEVVLRAGNSTLDAKSKIKDKLSLEFQLLKRIVQGSPNIGMQGATGFSYSTTHTLTYIQNGEVKVLDLAELEALSPELAKTTAKIDAIFKKNFGTMGFVPHTYAQGEKGARGSSKRSKRPEDPIYTQMTSNRNDSKTKALAAAQTSNPNLANAAHEDRQLFDTRFTKAENFLDNMGRELDAKKTNLTTEITNVTNAIATPIGNTPANQAALKSLQHDLQILNHLLDEIKNFDHYAFAMMVAFNPEKRENLNIAEAMNRAAQLFGQVNSDYKTQHDLYCNATVTRPSLPTWTPSFIRGEARKDAFNEDYAKDVAGSVWSLFDTKDINKAREDYAAFCHHEQIKMAEKSDAFFDHLLRALYTENSDSLNAYFKSAFNSMSKERGLELKEDFEKICEDRVHGNRNGLADVKTTRFTLKCNVGYGNGAILQIGTNRIPMVNINADTWIVEHEYEKMFQAGATPFRVAIRHLDGSLHALPMRPEHTFTRRARGTITHNDWDFTEDMA